MSRYRTSRPALSERTACPQGVRRRYVWTPLQKRPGSPSLGLKYYHDPHAISQPDKPPINIRLILYFLRHGMWIITDFSLCTGITRALPGKRPLLVPARLRNPQNFHRLCTGLAPLRTSASTRLCTGSRGAVLFLGLRAACEEPETRWPTSAPCQVGRDGRPPPPGSRRPAGGSQVEGRACALVGTGMIKVLANLKPLPAADGCRILCDLSVAAGILITHTVHTCVITETHQPAS